MDSFTQIVLGAACGEIVAGKKMGNRAMLWGAVGGTIPDLDVIASAFTSEITSMTFHRGFMHSFLFAAIFPWILAYFSQWFYQDDIYRKRGYKVSFVAIWGLLYLGAAFGINQIPKVLNGGFSWSVFLPTLFLGLYFAYKLWFDYWKNSFSEVKVSYLTWVNLFFWSIFTHPILDCFTNWGTQIWQPFSDMRVQWSTVSVVDPICTLPFALLLWIASRFAKETRVRALLNWAGVLWFCGYLCVYTLWHKQTVNAAWRETLAQKGIKYNRIYTNPSIFNNIVWTSLAETDSAYYWSLYGFNDKKPGHNKISRIPKDQELIKTIPETDRANYFLKWFSDGYYNIKPYNGDTMQFNDLRFGLMGDTLLGNNYSFPLLVYKNEKGEWDVFPNNRNANGVKANKAAFGTLWDRVKGSY
jgi:inner membrane protein